MLPCVMYLEQLILNRLWIPYSIYICHFYTGTYQLHIYTLYSTVYTHLNDDSPSNGEVPVKPCVPYSPSIALNPYHLKPTLVQLRLRFHLYIRAQVSVGLTPPGNSSLLHNWNSYLYISWICLTSAYTKALKIRKIIQSIF